MQLSLRLLYQKLAELTARIVAQWHRRKLMLGCAELPWRFRLSQQFSRHPSARSFFLDQIWRDGDVYRFEKFGLRLVSAPIVAGEEEAGACSFGLVISEKFAIPMLFWKNVRPRVGGVVLDLGANIGTTAITLSDAIGPSGRVYSFEPVTYRTVATNVELNGFKNIAVVPSAVSSSCGSTEFLVSEFPAAARMAFGPSSPQPGIRSVVVPVTNLDVWCTKNGVETVDFIKMDVEGAEAEVVRGAQQLIQRCYPQWSISSEHLGPDGQPQHDIVVRLLKCFGYSVCEIGKEYCYAYRAQAG